MKTEVDERTQLAKLQVDALSYQVLAWGLAAIFLYRLFILKQPLSQNWDIFILSTGAGYVQIFSRRAKGILPSQKQRTIQWIMFVAFIVLFLYLGFDDLITFRRFTFDWITMMPFATLAGFVLFFLLFRWLERRTYRHWERRNLGESGQEE